MLRRLLQSGTTVPTQIDKLLPSLLEDRNLQDKGVNKLYYRSTTLLIVFYIKKKKGEKKVEIRDVNNLQNMLGYL